MIMASLSGLSNELILNIAGFILPDDIVNFSMTCKALHNLSSRYLIEDKRLHKTHRRWFDTKDNENLVTLLRRVLAYPRLAYYIREIECYIGGGELIDELTTDDLASFRTAFSNSRFGVFDERDINLSIEEIEKSNLEPILGLLMNMLPNLGIIDFSGYPGELVRFTSTAWNISKSASSAQSLKLHTMSFYYKESHSPASLSILHPFLILPSIKTIYANNIAYCLQHPLVPKSSSIIKLELHSCSFSEIELLQFFQIFKALESLEFSPKGTRDPRPQFNPSWIYNALSTHTKHSLKTLILEECVLLDSNGMEEPPLAAANFTAFPALTKLDISFTLLLGPPGPSQPPLSAVLPPSIKSLVTRSSFSIIPNQSVAKLVKDTIKDKISALPNLVQLGLFQPFYDKESDNNDQSQRAKEDKWRSMCATAGVNLQIRHFGGRVGRLALD